MAHTDKRLAVFAHLGDEWAPAGLLDMTEQGNELVASSFTYGVQYARRANAVEIDPVTLPLDTALAAPGAPMFPGTLEPPISGGIRDAAPDAWGRRLIEARLRVPANSLPESTYLLNVGRQRAGALDIRTDRNDLPEEGDGESVSNLDYLLEAAERVEEGLPIPVRLEAILRARPRSERTAGTVCQRAYARRMLRARCTAKELPRHRGGRVAQADLGVNTLRA
jgi:serine/threonine-protein kinase HipA